MTCTGSAPLSPEWTLAVTVCLRLELLNTPMLVRLSSSTLTPKLMADPV